MGKKDKAEKYHKKLGKLVKKHRGGALEVIVCTDDRKGGCAERGAKQVFRALRHELGRQGAPEELVCLRACEHFGPCKLGPNVVVAPSGRWHTNVTPDDVPAIVRALLSGADAAPLLVEETLLDA